MRGDGPDIFSMASWDEDISEDREVAAGHEPTYGELLSTHDGPCEFRVRG